MPTDWWADGWGGSSNKRNSRDVYLFIFGSVVNDDNNNVTVLNDLPCHGGVRMSGGMTPRISTLVQLSNQLYSFRIILEKRAHIP